MGNLPKQTYWTGRKSRLRIAPVPYISPSSIAQSNNDACLISRDVLHILFLCHGYMLNDCSSATDATVGMLHSGDGDLLSLYPFLLCCGLRGRCRGRCCGQFLQNLCRSTCHRGCSRELLLCNRSSSLLPAIRRSCNSSFSMNYLNEKDNRAFGNTLIMSFLLLLTFLCCLTLPCVQKPFPHSSQ